jgi:hypothetical protein
MNNRWHTTAKAERLICGLLTALGANLICREIGRGKAGGPAFAAVFIAGHADITGIVIYYILYGVKKRPGAGRKIIKTAALLAFLGILFFEGGKPVLLILSGIYVFFIVYLIWMTAAGKNNGDNMVREGGGKYAGKTMEFPFIDGLYFDYVNDLIYLNKASFPPDIENYKYGRKEGRIVCIGLINGREEKYGGEAGAAVQSGEKLYLCPLSQIKISGAAGGGTLASKGGEIVVKAAGGGVSDILVIGKEGMLL